MNDKIKNVDNVNELDNLYGKYNLEANERISKPITKEIQDIIEAGGLIYLPLTVCEKTVNSKEGGGLVRFYSVLGMIRKRVCRVDFCLKLGIDEETKKKKFDYNIIHSLVDIFSDLDMMYLAYVKDTFTDKNGEIRSFNKFYFVSVDLDSPLKTIFKYPVEPMSLGHKLNLGYLCEYAGVKLQDK